MKALFFLFMLILSGAPVIASTIESAILTFESSIDWQTDSIEVGAPTSDFPLIVIIECEKEGICKKQAADYGIRRQKKWTSGDPIKPLWGRFKGWGGADGSSGSCVARPKEFNIDGFAVGVSILWQTKLSGSGKFKEEFSCKWIPTQAFEKEGFKITVTIKQNE